MKCRVEGNIAAEMQAVVNALYIAHRLQLVQAADEVLIQTDCMAAIDAFEGKRRNLPAQEWEAVRVLRRLRSDHSLRVVFRHVKGHTGKKEARFVANHLCDKRAKEAMRRARGSGSTWRSAMTTLRAQRGQVPVAIMRVVERGGMA